MTSNTNPACEQALIKERSPILGSGKPDYALRAVNLNKVFHNRKNFFANTKTVVLSGVNINIEKNKM